MVCGSINSTTNVSVDRVTQTVGSVNKKKNSPPVKTGCSRKLCAVNNTNVKSGALTPCILQGVDMMTPLNMPTP